MQKRCLRGTQYDNYYVAGDLAVERPVSSTNVSVDRARQNLVSEFRDAVFEDVVFEHNINYLIL